MSRRTGVLAELMTAARSRPEQKRSSVCLFSQHAQAEARAKDLLPAGAWCAPTLRGTLSAQPKAANGIGRRGSAQCHAAMQRGERRADALSAYLSSISRLRERQSGSEWPAWRSASLTIIRSVFRLTLLLRRSLAERGTDSRPLRGGVQ